MRARRAGPADVRLAAGGSAWRGRFRLGAASYARRLVCFSVVLLAACSKHESVAADREQIQFRLDGDPPLSVSVTVTPKCELGPIANEIATLFHRAARACPELQSAVRNRLGVELELWLREGRVDTVVPAAGVERCLLEAIHARPMPSPCQGPVRLHARYGSAAELDAELAK